MNPIRLCIVGAGTLASQRIYPYIATAGAKLEGVCDLDPKKAEKNASLFGGRVYDNMELMLDQEKPDGVIICIGPQQHAALAPIVMRKGLPVYTEKPPAANSPGVVDVV